MTTFGDRVYQSGGVPVDGEFTTGNVFFVDSVNGSDSFSGKSPSTALATADAATNKCTANNHDIVYFMPNHAETIASSTTWVPDVAGVQYIGIGVGADAPEFTYSATGSKIAPTANNLTFKNIRFVAGISAVVVAVQVTGTHNTFDGCTWDFSGTTAYDFILALDLDTADYARVVNCRFIAENATAGAARAIRLDTSPYVVIENNLITGDYSAGVIDSSSDSGASLSLLIKNNDIYNDDTASTLGCIHFAVANTGMISYNNLGWLNDDEGDIIIDPGSCLLFENYTCNIIDHYGVATLVGAASS